MSDHEISHEHAQGVVRVVCSCGHLGPWRRTAMSRNDLLRDEQQHRIEVVS